MPPANEKEACYLGESLLSHRPQTAIIFTAITADIVAQTETFNKKENLLPCCIIIPSS